MRESRTGRLVFALVLSLLGGTVAYWNPVARLEAHLSVDADRVERSVQTATGDLAREIRTV